VIVQIATMNPKPGRSAAVLDALRQASAAARLETGTLVFAVHQEFAPDGGIHMYEIYQSVEDQLAHSSSAATAVLRAAVADNIVGPIAVRKCELIEQFGLPLNVITEPSP
jgi:quinol monooxygenase YgiN